MVEHDRLNPYQPPAPAASEVTHHFSWRSADTTLTVGTQERHQVTIRQDFLTAKTIILIDGQEVRAFRYLFIPPDVQLEFGQSERHQVEIDLNRTFFRDCHAKVDGQVLAVPLVPPGLLLVVRLGTVLMPIIASAVFAASYFMWRDWIQDLLVHLIVALTLFLLAFVVFVECIGWVRIKRVRSIRSQSSAHATPRSPNAR